uniref:Methyltransferase-like protein 13 n=1 Tax=Tanacetum cinerariifolium TaxID=118510 RepID=A0A6L2LU08_TANCI|nr:methyltransferase-like protein 13 [Tanacetum cinerariifolium]
MAYSATRVLTTSKVKRKCRRACRTSEQQRHQQFEIRKTCGAGERKGKNVAHPDRGTYLWSLPKATKDIHNMRSVGTKAWYWNNPKTRLMRLYHIFQEPKGLQLYWLENTFANGDLCYPQVTQYASLYGPGYLLRFQMLAFMLSPSDSICSGGGTDGSSDGESGLDLLRDEDGNSDESSGYRYQHEWPLKGLLGSISDNAFQIILAGKDWKVGHRVASVVKYVAELARALALMSGVFPASYTNHGTNANCKKDAKKSTPCGDRYQREWPLKGLLGSISDNAFKKILAGKDWKVGHRVASVVVGGNNIVSTNLEPNVYVRSNVVNREEMEVELKGLVIALHPKLCFRSGVPEPLFLVYEDDVVCSVVVDKFVGAFVGEFVVEDVEIGSKEFRRRLRFRRMPNLIQSQARLVASFGEGVCETCDRGLGLERMRELKGVEFRVDTSLLVHPYLTPMVCGLFLIVGSLNERIQLGFCPRALCLGVGGGALLSFMNNELGFEVVGVEADEVVLSVARQYFGLNDGKSVQVIVGDAIEMIEKVACGVSVDGLDAKFDVVMVDLDSSEARSGISAPPPEFVRKSVFQAMRSFLCDHGVLVINVISPNKVFYEKLVQELQDVFYKVFEMDVENDGNVVLMATLTPITSDDHGNAFLTRLKSVISGTSVDSIVELWPPSSCVMHCSEIAFRDSVQKVQPGSHHRLFFPCDFPKRNWYDIMDYIRTISKSNGVWRMTGWLTLAAAVYHVWKERNSRIHNMGLQSIDKVVQLAKSELVLALWRHSEDSWRKRSEVFRDLRPEERLE